MRRRHVNVTALTPAAAGGGLPAVGRRIDLAALVARSSRSSSSGRRPAARGRRRDPRVPPRAGRPVVTRSSSSSRTGGSSTRRSRACPSATTSARSTSKPAPGGGTTIHWHSSFYPATAGTGWIVERGIRRFLEQCARGLAEYAAAHIDSNAA